MHKTFIIAIFGAFASPTISALLDKRVLNDPVGIYISHMCLPLLSNTTRASSLRLSVNQMIPSLANSPFPCEQQLYLEQVCTANGTTEVDFLAEQQCLCGSPLFEIMSACEACYFAHGSPGSLSPAEASASFASLQTAECSPSPPYQPFTNLLSITNITSISLRPSLTLGIDRFPNMTAVSNYDSVTRTVTPGSITGSATARLTSWTNYDGYRYTPTSTPSQSAKTTSTSAGSAGGAGVSSSSTTSAPASVTSKSSGASEVQAAGGVMAVALGLAVML